MKKGQTVWLIEHDGSKVMEREFLREDNLFVYWRYRGEKGRGSSHPKMFAYDNGREAYLEAARLLENKAGEYREMAGE